MPVMTMVSVKKLLGERIGRSQSDETSGYLREGRPRSQGKGPEGFEQLRQKEVDGSVCKFCRSAHRYVGKMTERAAARLVIFGLFFGAPCHFFTKQFDS